MCVSVCVYASERERERERMRHHLPSPPHPVTLEIPVADLHFTSVSSRTDGGGAMAAPPPAAHTQDTSDSSTALSTQPYLTEANFNNSMQERQNPNDPYSYRNRRNQSENWTGCLHFVQLLTVPGVQTNAFSAFLKMSSLLYVHRNR